MQGVIITPADTPHSYIVKGSNRRKYCCNLRHIRNVTEACITSHVDDDQDKSEPAEQTIQSQKSNNVQADSSIPAQIVSHEPAKI